MDIVSSFFLPCDCVVGKLHDIIGIPWEESVNRHIPFGLPGEGLAFPMLLGRLVYLGVLAGILICLITLIGGKRRLTIREGVRRYGDDYTITVDTGVHKLLLKGQKALDYVVSNVSRFEKQAGPPRSVPFPSGAGTGRCFPICKTAEHKTGDAGMRLPFYV